MAVPLQIVRTNVSSEYMLSSSRILMSFIVSSLVVYLFFSGSRIRRPRTNSRHSRSTSTNLKAKAKGPKQLRSECWCYCALESTANVTAVAPPFCCPWLLSPSSMCVSSLGVEAEGRGRTVESGTPEAYWRSQSEGGRPQTAAKWTRKEGQVERLARRRVQGETRRRVSFCWFCWRDV